jgi:hypothetical protein
MNDIACSSFDLWIDDFGYSIHLVLPISNKIFDVGVCPSPSTTNLVRFTSQVLYCFKPLFRKVTMFAVFLLLTVLLYSFQNKTA